jgi:large repetitive protein
VVSNAHTPRLRAIILAAVVALSVGLIGAPPSAAAPPAPGGLTPSNQTIAGSPVLEWSRVSPDATYRVEVSTTAGFEKLLWSVSSTVNRRAVPNVQLPKGEIWWRVRAIDSAGTGPWAIASFDRSSINGPTLVAPTSDTTLQQPDEPALLSWTPVPGAKSYTIEVDDADDFIGASTYTTKTTSYVVPTPQVKKDYYWHVRATLDGSILTEWSEARHYSIGGLSQVQQVSPQNGADVQVQDVVLDWNPVRGAATYDLQVSTDRNFLTFDGGIEVNGIKGTRYSPPTSLNNDQYFWRVRPVDAQGNKLDWVDPFDAWQFQRNWPHQPTLEYPVGGARVGNPIYYQWTGVEHASEYRLEISRDPNFGTIEDACTTVHTTFTPQHRTDCWPVQHDTYYWRVMATDEPQSRPTRITTDLISAQVGQFIYTPDLVNLTSPTHGAAVDVPVLTWDAVPGASRYRVTITAVDGGSGGGSTDTSALSFTPRTKLTVGKTYRWQVRVLSESGRLGPEFFPEDQPRFTVGEQEPPTAVEPDALGPVEGEYTRFPHLRWTPVEDATSYQVWVKRKEALQWTQISGSFAYPSGVDDKNGFLSEGDYEWHVRAMQSSQVLSIGEPGQFRIRSLTPVTGHSTAMTGEEGRAPGSCRVSLPSQCEELKQTPVLSWDEAPEAGYYRLWISRDKEMTNVLSGYPKTVEQSHWMSPDALWDSQAGSAFYWSVQPCKAGGVCSPPAHATHAFSKLSNGVHLLGPANGAEVADDVTLTWQDYLRTNLANPDQTTGVPARVEAERYRVETSVDPNFQSKLESVVVDQTTFTSFSTTYPEGPVYWRVQAIDGSGNPLAWSEVRNFLKRSPTPTLTSPTNNRAVGSTEPFRWAPLPFAASYDVEVYRDNDVVGSAANRVLSGNSKQVAFTTTTPLPAASTPYTWRVRRVDASGRKGAWSDLGASSAKFRVAGDVPVLTGPSAGQRLGAREALFSWQSVSGASGYRLERRVAGSSSLSETVTTPGLAWAPPKVIADGMWEWRVSTLDAANKVLATTPWRGFTVDGSAPTVTRKAPSGTVKRTSNFKATFSEPVTNVTASTMRIRLKGASKYLKAKVSVNSAGQTATLNPSADLKKRKVYVVSLSNAIRDVSGNALVPTSWKVRAK